MLEPEWLQAPKSIQCTVITSGSRHNTRERAHFLMHVRTVLFGLSPVAYICSTSEQAAKQSR